MILLFLGSWRSTVIIAISIPLAILGSIALLAAFGETLNIMTLGGLALAVGILVDDATVTIENINWHLEQGKDVETAIMDGARQIVTPAFVSLLCICIVFVPMFFLEGVARFLFVPMAEAVMFAMICSFILSRTLVPTMANYLLKPHAAHARRRGAPPSRNPLVHFQRGFEARFERFRAVYRDLLAMALAQRGRCSSPASWPSCWRRSLLAPFLGRNFFPSVDSGQILMHARVPVGTRVEETRQPFRRHPEGDPPDHPAARDRRRIVDNVGMPVSGINMTYNNTGMIGSAGRRHPDQADRGSRADRGLCARSCAAQLPERFPGVTFSFLPADIISQILNFGAPSPIDVQVRGSDLDAGLRASPTSCWPASAPCRASSTRASSSRAARRSFAVDIDRTRAQYVGLTTRDVTNSLVVNLAGSGQVAPTYWLNPANGVSYTIVMQTPQYRLDSLSSLSNLPIMAPAATSLQVLGGVADIRRDSGQRRGLAVRPAGHGPGLCRRAGPRSRRRGDRRPRRSWPSWRPSASPKVRAVKVQGQVQTMESAFSGLLFGLSGRDRADLSADRRELPVVERSLRHHHRAAGGAGRHRLDAVRHRHDACRCRRSPAPSCAWAWRRPTRCW